MSVISAIWERENPLSIAGPRDGHEYQPTGSLSIRERVGVRVNK